MTINYRAVRSFNRVWSPIAERLDHWADCDAQFDGGEWSNSFSDRIYQTELEEVAARVAARFSLSGADLLRMVEAAGHEEQHYWMIPSLLRKQAG